MRPYQLLRFFKFWCPVYPQIVFNAIQTFGLVLNKIKAICCVLFDKIEGSLQKHHILLLNMSINLYKSLL